MRCFIGNTWNTRLFAEGTGISPRAIRADKRRCCNIPTTSMLPQCPLDEADKDRNLLQISKRSFSLRIEPMIHLRKMTFGVLRIYGLRSSTALPVMKSVGTEQ